MRALTALFIERPVMSLMCLLAVVLLGALSLSKLPAGLLPDLSNPGITITTRYPGTAAGKIDELITTAVEREVGDIPGIKRIHSVSSEGESKVNVLFEYDADLKSRILEAGERITGLRSRFPREVEEPVILQYDPSNQPVFIVSFASRSLTLTELRGVVERSVKPRFERLDGVSEVFVGGGFEREVQILIDAGKTALSGVPAGRVSQWIAQSNVSSPGGTIRTQVDKTLVTTAKFRSVEEIRALDLPGKNGTLIPLQNLALVQDHYRERESIAKSNGEERVTVYVQKSGNANTLTLSKQCSHMSAAVTLPGVEHRIEYDQGSLIRTGIRRVSEACLTGALIVCVVLLVFLGDPGKTLVIASTLPVSILAAFLPLYLLHIDLNVMSLSGLALGAGMLIDTSIVVSESIEARSKAAGGYSRAVVLDGVSRVAPEVTAATLCIIVVFVPLFLTDPDTSRLFTPLCAAVISSMAASLFFSLTILPCFLSLYAGGRFSVRVDQWTTRVRTQLNRAARCLQGRRARVIQAALINVSQACDSLTLNRITARYRRFLCALSRHPRRISTFVVLVLILGAFGAHQLKREYFDPLETGEIEATVDLETGTDLQATEAVVSRIETALRGSPYVSEVSSRIEKWHATLHIKPRTDKGRPAPSKDITADLMKRVDAFKDEAFVHFGAAGEDSQSRELTIDFVGDDLDILKNLAVKSSSGIQAEVPGVLQVIRRFREPKGEIRIVPDRVKAAAAGTSLQETGSMVRTLLSGSVITKFLDGGREVDVRLRARAAETDTPESTAALVLPLESGPVPLTSVATLTDGTSETRIWRKNKRKSVSISLRLGDISADRAAAGVDAYFRRAGLPEDVIYDFGDDYQKTSNGHKRMPAAVLLSILIMYFLLGALFENPGLPLLILLPVPLSIPGLLIFLWAAGASLNMGVYVGMIMLGGIAVTNSILLVSVVHQAVQGVKPAPGRVTLLHTIARAASTRIRPVCMTTISAFFGMLPLAVDSGFGSALWRPLASTAAFGLLFSTAVSLIIVPLASFAYFQLVPCQPKGEINAGIVD